MKILLLGLFLPGILLAQSVSPAELHVDLLFGHYLNDHHEKKFHVREQHWVLEEGHLRYTIDQHERRYADTLALTDVELDSVRQLIEKHKLLRDIEKAMEARHINKMGYSESIRGTIAVEGKAVEIKIRSTGPGVLDKDKDCQRLDDLQQMFYRFIEAHR